MEETTKELVCIVWADEGVLQATKAQDVSINFLTEYPGVIRVFEPDNIDPRVGEVYFPDGFPNLIETLAKGDGTRIAATKSHARQLLTPKDQIPFSDEYYG